MVSLSKYISILIFTLSIIHLPGKLQALINLEATRQDFVLETKQINIEGYPDAFNPSIVRWNGKVLMSFRARDPLTNSASLVGFSWLNENFDPVGNPQMLIIKRS